MTKHILIVGDEPAVRQDLTAHLQECGFDADNSCDSSAKAVLRLQEGTFRLLVIDLQFSGLDPLLGWVTGHLPNLPVLLITDGSVPSNNAALELGAVSTLARPIDLVTVQTALDVALGRGRFGIVGRSAVMLDLYDIIEQAAPAPSTVLLTGESGTGKELVARALHENSDRKDGPFIAINCGAIPKSLFESELFGHDKGSFTGATQAKPGRLEQANEGTVFLDEIGELPLDMQVKLLRVLQVRRIHRVGGKGPPIEIDIRVIAATNVDLEQAIQQARFRSDLYYRLKVVSIHLPSLRERTEDIPLLVDHFRQVFNSRLTRSVRNVTPEALSILQRYEWPGNVRELENLIERTVLLTRGDTIQLDNLNNIPIEPSPSVPEPVEAPQKTVSPHKQVIHALEQHGECTAERLAQLTGLGKRRVEKYLRAERKKGTAERRWKGEWFHCISVPGSLEWRQREALQIAIMTGTVSNGQLRDAVKQERGAVRTVLGELVDRGWLRKTGSHANTQYQVPLSQWENVLSGLQLDRMPDETLLEIYQQCLAKKQSTPAVGILEILSERYGTRILELVPESDGARQKKVVTDCLLELTRLFKPGCNVEQQIATIAGRYASHRLVEERRSRALVAAHVDGPSPQSNPNLQLVEDEGIYYLTPEQRAAWREAIRREIDNLDGTWTKGIQSNLLQQAAARTDRSRQSLGWYPGITDRLREFLKESLPTTYHDDLSPRTVTLWSKWEGKSEERIAELALAASCDYRRTGQTTLAIEGWSYALQHVNQPALKKRILIEWLRVAMQDRRPFVLNHLLTVAIYVFPEDEDKHLVLHLIHGRMAVDATGQIADALERMSSEIDAIEYLRAKVLIHFANMSLKTWQSRYDQAERILTTLLERTDGFAAENRHSIEAVYLSMKGIRAYRLGRYNQAVEECKRASLIAPDLIMKLAFKLNAASYACALLDYAQAEGLATTAWCRADEFSLPLYQLHAHRLLRRIAYSRCEDLLVEPAYLTAIGLLSVKVEQAMASLTEAAFAWRAGEIEVARHLAYLCYDLAPNHLAGLLSRALLAACSEIIEPNKAEQLAAKAIEEAPPAVCVQVLGLLATSHPTPLVWQAHARRLAKELPNPDTRREVLSITEALVALHS